MEKEKSHRIRFNEEQINAILSVASVLNNKDLGDKTIANFGYIVAKLYKIKKKWENGCQENKNLL